MSESEVIVDSMGVPPQDEVQILTKEIPYAPGIAPRREINAYWNPSSPLLQKQWTLFVYALHEFQKLPVDNPYSYFQIAGIHGFPATSWEGAPPPDQHDPDDPSDPYLYCHHDSISFGPWHRPYLLLFESEVIKHMHKVITSWSLPVIEAELWTHAANTWRLPYWDYAAKQALPACFTVEEVPVFTPPSIGKKKEQSPFWKFENPEKDANGKPLKFGSMPPNKSKYNIKDADGAPWSLCTATSRYGVKKDTSKPNGWAGLDGVNDHATANVKLAAYKVPAPPVGKIQDPDWRKEAPISDAITRMFSKGYHKTWGTFASTKWRNDKADGVTQYLSLEQLHNGLHNLTGGNGINKGEAVGHMFSVPVSAFDPIFWMHHCNIDRLLAVWQSLYPDLWWDTKEPPTPVDPKRTIRPDPPPTEPLLPFREPKGPKGFWSANMVRDWTTLGYTYDLLKPNSHAVLEDDTLDEKQFRRDLRAQIYDTYDDTSNLAREIYKNDDLSNEKYLGADDGTYKDYFINVLYDRYALSGRSYTIEFYFEEEEEHPVGHVFSFSGMPLPTETEGGCQNCASNKAARSLSKAQVSLTIPLIHRALSQDFVHINDIQNDSVDEYLKKSLRWRFIESGGSERAADDFPDTLISVWSGKGILQRVEVFTSSADTTEKVPDLSTYEDYGLIYQSGSKRDEDLQESFLTYYQ